MGICKGERGGEDEAAVRDWFGSQRHVVKERVERWGKRGKSNLRSKLASRRTLCFINAIYP